MCGIAGFIDNRGIDASTAEALGRAMAEAIIHRGWHYRGILAVKAPTRSQHFFLSGCPPRRQLQAYLREQQEMCDITAPNPDTLNSFLV